MEELYKELGNELREEMLSSTANAFAMSLEMMGQPALINDNSRQVILNNPPQGDGSEKVIAAYNGEINIGDKVSMNNQMWLVWTIPIENSVYSKATLKLCNSSFPLLANKTKVLKGHNKLGKPIYADQYEVDTQEPCVVLTGRYATDTGSQLVVPDNSVLITIKYQQSDTFKVNYEFSMYNNNYKITDIDYTKVINEKGIISITAERV